MPMSTPTPSSFERSSSAVCMSVRAPTPSHAVVDAAVDGFAVFQRSSPAPSFTAPTPPTPVASPLRVQCSPSSAPSSPSRPRSRAMLFAGGVGSFSAAADVGTRVGTGTGRRSYPARYSPPIGGAAVDAAVASQTARIGYSRAGIIKLQYFHWEIETHLHARQRRGVETRFRRV